LLTESVTLSIAGGATGLLLSVWALEFLKRVGARTIPRLSEVGLDFNVVVVTVLVSVGTGILFGLVPAWVSTKPELTEALKEGGRGSTTGSRRNRIRNSLVVAEIALALVLLVGAGLLMKSFARLQSVNAGFNPQNVLTMEVSLPESKYPRPTPGTSGPDSRGVFFAEALRRINRLPGLEASGATTILPLSGGNSDSSFGIEGRAMKPGTPGPDEEIRTITPGYFQVLQTPLRRGRFFNDGDTATSPQVAIINDALARKYWPNEDPVGKRITFSDTRKPNPKWITIVGLVGSVRHKGLEFDPEPEYYLPHAQDPSRNMLVAVRSTQDPRSLASAIRREIQAMDPELPIANVRTFDTVVAESIAPRRLSVLLLGIFAGIALVLATVGTYGVISYLVVQRTHEIGVRMALGAQRRDVLRLVVGHALKLVGIGIAIGLVLAVFSSRTLAALLYNVGAFDPVTFMTITGLLALTALLASYIPALRATRADPMIALSHNG
jgi:putative ABC transport system permease protein